MPLPLLPLGLDQIIPTVLSIGSSVGSALGSIFSDSPDAPNYAAATRAGAEAEAETLADRRRVEALARLGLEGEAKAGPLAKQKWKEYYVKVPDPNNPKNDLKVPYVAEDWQDGGQYYHLTEGGTKSPKIITKARRGKRPTDAQLDFTGYGDADIQGAIARQIAEGQLELDREYGQQYVDLSNELRQLSDPEGVAGRRLLYESILEDIAKADQAQRPVAELLDKQLLEEAMLGKGLDADATDAIARSLGSRRGENIGMDEITQNLVTGQMGLDRQNFRTDKGLSYLMSGATPEDTAYRRNQQGLGNMASFLRGETPVAQFGQLSGAQGGAAPFPTGPGLPQYTGNIANQVTGQYARNYGYETQAAANQVNPWFAGLSLAVEGAGTLGKAGWKPLS